MMARYGLPIRFGSVCRNALVALIAAMPLPASSQGSPKQFEDVLESLRLQQENEEPVATFGDWRIVHLKSQDAFELIGVGIISIPPLSSDTTRAFTMACFRNSDTLQIMIPFYSASPEIRKAPFLKVSYWNDLGTQGEMGFANFQNAALIIKTGVSEEIDANIKRFVSAMTEAKKFFAWSYEGKTVRYSADDIVVAFGKWKSMCALLKIPSPAHAFEQQIGVWTLQSYETPLPFILLHEMAFASNGKPLSVGMSCTSGDRAIVAGPLEGGPDDATISYSCDGGPPSIPMKVHGSHGMYVASKTNNVGTGSAVTAFPDTLLAAREKCTFTIGGDTHELDLHGIQAAVPAYYAACAARDY
jgi:hypothetical protein